MDVGWAVHRNYKLCSRPTRPWNPRFSLWPSTLGRPLKPQAWRGRLHGGYGFAEHFRQFVTRYQRASVGSTDASLAALSSSCGKPRFCLGVETLA